MIKNTILDFPKQFSYEPVIENSANLKKSDGFVVCGMGGSHLAADLLKIWNPELDLIVHKNYGLPDLPEKFLKERLIIISSYSGNTEEMIDSFEEALDKKLKIAVIAARGELLELARKNSIPYIAIPDTDIPPRMALGFCVKALFKITGDEKSLNRIAKLSESLDAKEFEEWGRDLAEKINGFVPVVYSSEKNLPVAYNWKIKFNENSKIPAFCNAFPELNHNEINGFDVSPATRGLAENFYFIFLMDENDNPSISKRMSVLGEMYRERGFNVEVLGLESDDEFHKIFSSLILADWVTYSLADIYCVEPEPVPMVSEFKKRISEF
ncbi:hypothetical protein HY227_01525 [Candidatus Wolfebacteria bacterium]|nr:hypothetical protein [Candidatus Wolfebacteria bacterium]